MSAEKAIFSVLLLLGTLFSLGWGAVPEYAQGDYIYVAFGVLLTFACWALYMLASKSDPINHRFFHAAAMAVGIAQLSTAACSLAWLIHPFERAAGESQCTDQWGIPLRLVSALFAAVAVAQWRPAK